jgi:hypothetical protein
MDRRLFRKRNPAASHEEEKNGMHAHSSSNATMARTMMMTINCWSCIALISLRGSFSFSLTSLIRHRPSPKPFPQSQASLPMSSSMSSWSVTDDWNDLSTENPMNGIQSEDVYNQVLGDKAARAFESSSSSFGGEEDGEFQQDPWLRQTFDRLFQDDVTISGDSGSHDHVGDLAGAAVTAGADAHSKAEIDEQQFLEDMGEEISLLVRCNEDPTQLLIRSGKALPPLTRPERDELRQLISAETWEPTVFLTEAVAGMFNRYASKAPTTNKAAEKEEDTVDVTIMDRNGVAEWFSVCSGKPVGPHDPRVQSILSRFGDYGRGALTLPNLLDLYVKAIIGDRDRHSTPWSSLQKLRGDGIAQVWRDVRRHGILGPVELERKLLALQLEDDLKKNSAGAMGGSMLQASAGMLLDECEIVDDELIASKSLRKRASGPKSSHQLVELADDGKTPLWMQDGDFGTLRSVAINARGLAFLIIPIFAFQFSLTRRRASVVRRCVASAKASSRLYACSRFSLPVDPGASICFVAVRAGGARVVPHDGARRPGPDVCSEKEPRRGRRRVDLSRRLHALRGLPGAGGIGERPGSRRRAERPPALWPLGKPRVDPLDSSPRGGTGWRFQSQELLVPLLEEQVLQ